MFVNNYYYILLNYTLESTSWASSTCVLFILLMQLVNGAQSLNIIFLLTSLLSAYWAAMFATVIVPLTSIYSSL